MRRPPRPPEEPILGHREWGTVAFTGLLQAAVALAVFAWALEARNLDEARNLAFSALVFGELLRAFSARDADRSFWEVGLFTNLRLMGVVAVSVLVQLGIHHIPAAQTLFQIGALSLFDCTISVVAGSVPFAVIELTKLGRRMARRG
jgi:Ca2+-transporting ATPase